MRLTVIIPTTGERETLLARALASVGAQKHSASRVVVVVDGPAAVRATVARQVDGFEVIGGDGRRGVSSARNIGARAAGDGFLAFLDDDDAWKAEYLEAVFGLGADVDVVLTAFEKHTATGHAPEKVPPEFLDERDFLVRNPGLRGSNLVIRRSAYEAIRGFDERLPAFNDLDFGIRLARSRPRYRRVVEPLVEFHSHRGPRLSTAGCDANRVGMRRFLELHRASMSAGEVNAFRERAQRLWGIDPLSVESRAGEP